MSAQKMHHRKRGALIPWTGMIRFDGKPEFRLGTVYTFGHDQHDARRQLEKLASEVFPGGWTLGWIGRGALIYRPCESPNAAGDGAEP